MGHKHSVLDTDTRFIINPITRQIVNDTNRKITLIQGDHNSEIFGFSIPRYVEKHDMSLCNVTEVHYFNISTATQEKESGIYEVKDLQIDPENDENVIFSWLISNNATMLEGALNFLVRFKCVESDGSVSYAWNTGFFNNMMVSKGSDADVIFEEKYIDIIEQWKASVLQIFEDEFTDFKSDTEAAISEDIENKFKAHSSQLEQKLAVERARIDQFTKLEEGSTTGDAELMDVRIGANGETYANAGEAVRTQFLNNSNEIKQRYSEVNDYLNKFGKHCSMFGTAFKKLNPIACVEYETIGETIIHAYGKNALPFDVISISQFEEYDIRDLYVSAVLEPGNAYKFFTLADIFLKAGTYNFGFECFANDVNVYEQGINTFGVAYIYKKNDDGTETLVHACASYEKLCHTITLSDDGYYAIKPYFVVNKEITEKTTVKIGNIFISETETTFSKYEGESIDVAIGKGLLVGFEGMNIVSKDDIYINFADSLEDEKNTVVCWGDSLTQGTGSTAGKPTTETNIDCSYPAVLARKIGNALIVKNHGIGGETSWQIASRQGGMSVEVLPFTLPDEIKATRVYLKGQEQNYFYDNQSGKWTLSENNLNYNFSVDEKAGVNPCKIGGVIGNLSRVQLLSGSVDPETGETVQSNTYAYYFTRLEKGNETVFSTPQQLITYASEAYRKSIHIIWMGQNDAPEHDGSYIMQIGFEDRMQCMINNIDGDKYIVMDYPSGTNEDSAKRNQMMNLKFGKRYLNIREYIAKYGVGIANSMNAGIEITEEDATLIASGKIPSCLRSDSVHGNYWYYQIVAKAVHEKGKALGYWQ